MKNISNLFVRLFVVSLFSYIPFLSAIVSLFGAGADPFFTAPAPAPVPRKLFRWLQLRLRLRPKCVGSGGSGSGSASLILTDSVCLFLTTFGDLCLLVVVYATPHLQDKFSTPLFEVKWMLRFVWSRQTRWFPIP